MDHGAILCMKYQTGILLAPSIPPNIIANSIGSYNLLSLIIGCPPLLRIPLIHPVQVRRQEEVPSPFHMPILVLKKKDISAVCQLGSALASRSFLFGVGDWHAGSIWGKKRNQNRANNKGMITVGVPLWSHASQKQQSQKNNAHIKAFVLCYHHRNRHIQVRNLFRTFQTITRTILEQPLWGSNPWPWVY